jgi:hypothetical protein
MSIPSNITISQDVIFKELDGEAVLFDLQSERYFGLDEVGTRMWHLLTENSDTETILTQLLVEFDVDETTLRQDVTHWIAELVKAGLVTVNKE